MVYSIGQVAKLFGVSVESIVYYEKEGLIHLKKNPNNGYRQFTIEDIILLSDILFYRNVDISIKQIARIQKGMDMEGISSLINGKITEITNKISKYNTLLTKLENWATLHNEDGINLVGKFDIREMPVAIKPIADIDEFETDIIKFMDDLHDNKEMIYYLFYAFSCNISNEEENQGLHRYVVLDSGVGQNLPFQFKLCDYEEEYCEKSLYSVVKYTDNTQEMLKPLVDYADKNGIALTGKIYGRLCIVNYEKGEYTEYYRVYAEIK
ncbi:MerR family transcriptional regulator [Aminipila terrae]|uniref:MerR family transcriptional regulator n=1 Tax=Aminipila terrae TaxID=2697030 RepID=A0A6P1MD12_9FIRM|nr:MerR family transcriptional regulator [Aminipila terrae]QHI71013.1 MerR family transcriptional regulator [Aminipila terrae]